VQAEVERAPVHRQERAAAEHRERRQRVGRPEVDAAPRRMPRADLEHRQIERPEPRADLAELVGEAGVAREEQPPPRGGEHPRRPQRAVAAGQAAPREVLRRRRGEADVLDGRRLPPVELGDERGLDAVRLEVRADAERGDERHPPRRQLAHAGLAQVIEVIVRQEHRVERRQLGDRRRHRVEPPRPGEADRRRALAEHRIGQHPRAVELEQHRAVAEPGHAQAVGRHRAGPGLVRSLERQRRPRDAGPARRRRTRP
jgi:hypothetical protein